MRTNPAGRPRRALLPLARLPFCNIRFADT